MTGVTNAQGMEDRLNLRVFGGTTAPSNPKNNDIWVKTSIAIPNYSVYINEANSNFWTGAANGGIYIKFEASGSGATTGANIITYRSNSNLQEFNVNFLGCMQIMNGVWANVEAYVYHNGWHQFSSAWNGELFDNGNQYEGVTGGWVGNGISSTTVGTNLSLIVANTSPYLTTQNAIDLSGYTKLHMIADGNAGQYSYFGISSNVPSNARPNYIASATFIGGENVLDVSSINSGHISIGASASWGVTINISKVWLE